MEKKKTNRYWIFMGIIVVGLLVLLAIFFDEVKIFFIKLIAGEITKADAKVFMNSFGVKGASLLCFLSCLQVVLPVLPAEPVQVVAGMAYGVPAALLICAIGVFVGNTVIFVASRSMGSKITKHFREKLAFDLTSVRAVGKITQVVLIMYLLPAIPYGMICFMTASTGMKFVKYTLLTTLASLPSILIGVCLGSIAINTGWILTLFVLVLLFMLIIILYVKRESVYALINRKVHESEKPFSSSVVVKKPNRLLYPVVRFLAGLYIKRKVLLKVTGDVKRLDAPSIVIANHPSFMDWLYVGTIIPNQLNFIAARYYFFQKKLKWLLRNMGAFPKSMFSTDIESGKNCFRVIRNGGVLSLMPEARLSCDGAFETIATKTAKMIKKMGVAVTIVHFDGAYLANPKWGKGYRKGAIIEAHIESLLTSEDVLKLTEDEIGDTLNRALDYDDFKWLESRPNVHYTDKNLAEGLENLLFLCPECGSMSGMTTSELSMCCEKCGYTVTLNDRYEFKNDKYGLKNLQVWYQWQRKQLACKIDKQYVLSSHVRVKLPSKDGKTFFRECGEGHCILSWQGLVFEGKLDGVETRFEFPLATMYRLLFGAGEDFEIYDGSKFYYFMPDNLRECVQWYVASGLLVDKFHKGEDVDEQ